MDYSTLRVYVHGHTIINESWVCDSSTVWPQFRIELMFYCFHIEHTFFAGMVLSAVRTFSRPTLRYGGGVYSVCAWS